MKNIKNMKKKKKAQKESNDLAKSARNHGQIHVMQVVPRSTPNHRNETGKVSPMGSRRADAEKTSHKGSRWWPKGCHKGAKNMTQCFQTREPCLHVLEKCLRGKPNKRPSHQANDHGCQNAGTRAPKRQLWTPKTTAIFRFGDIKMHSELTPAN